MIRWSSHIRRSSKRDSTHREDNLSSAPKGEFNTVKTSMLVACKFSPCTFSSPGLVSGLRHKSLQVSRIKLKRVFSLEQDDYVLQIQSQLDSLGHQLVRAGSSISCTLCHEVSNSTSFLECLDCLMVEDQHPSLIQNQSSALLLVLQVYCQTFSLPL